MPYHLQFKRIVNFLDAIKDALSENVKTVMNHLNYQEHQNQLMLNNILIYINAKPETEIKTHITAVYFPSDDKIINELNLSFNQINSHVKMKLVFSEYINYKSIMNMKITVIKSSIKLHEVAHINVHIISYQFALHHIISFENCDNNALLNNVKESVVLTRFMKSIISSNLTISICRLMTIIIIYTCMICLLQLSLIHTMTISIRFKTFS